MLKQVLHVGCGPPNPQALHATFHGDGWRELRLDINPAVQPDIIASMTQMDAVASGSMDAVWSSHNLEHLYAHEVPLALAEFYRVLKPDGFTLITLPDLQSVAQLIVEDKLEQMAYQSPAGPIAAIDMLYGHRGYIARGNQHMGHRTGFTARTLGDALVRVGFARAEVKRGKAYDLWAIAHKTLAPQAIPINGD
jgi:SAM-dependent methyltransferase